MNKKKNDKLLIILISLIVLFIISLLIVKEIDNNKLKDILGSILVVLIVFTSISTIIYMIIEVFVFNKKEKRKLNTDLDLNNIPQNDEESKFIFKANFYMVKFNDYGLELVYDNETILINYHNLEIICFHDTHIITRQPIFTLLFKANIDEEELSFALMLTKDLLYVVRKYNLEINNIDIINSTIKEEKPLYKKKVYIGNLWKNIVWCFISLASAFLLSYYIPNLFWLFIILFLTPFIINVINVIFNNYEYEIRCDSLKIYNHNKNVHYFNFMDITKIEKIPYDELDVEYIEEKEKIVVNLLCYYPPNEKEEIYVITTYQGIYLVSKIAFLEETLNAYFVLHPLKEEE